MFQGWLEKYHAIEYAELPQERTEVVVSAGTGYAGTEGGEVKKTEEQKGGEQVWNRTPWIPEIIEKKFYQISALRRGAVSIRGNTIVDANVELNSVKAFVVYFPRALQLGLLSPLPELWRGKGSTPAMTMARKVMGVVTLVFYVCLIGLLVGIVTFRKNFGFWIIVMYCLFGILVYAYTYPNVGTLLRYRYGFYMALISFGSACIAEMGLGWLKKKRQKYQT